MNDQRTYTLHDNPRPPLPTKRRLDNYRLEQWITYVLGLLAAACLVLAALVWRRLLSG